jgi:trigger factor
LKIETFDRDDHQKLVTAEVESEMMERFQHSAARKISAQAKIAGFRPGKAPYEVVRRMFGDKAIQEEAIQIMLEEVYPQVIKDAGIEPYGPGRLEEITQLDPPKFSFIVPLVPEVTMGDYRAIRADYSEPTLSDEKVDEVLRRLQRRSAISKTVERPAAKGDMVTLHIAGQLSNPAEGEDGELIPPSNRQMIAGDSSDSMDAAGHEWPFKGFSDNLIGMVAGEDKIFSHVFEDDGSTDDLTGKEGTFTVKIDTISELELRPIDDEFAQAMGSYENLEALKTAIRQDIQLEETRRYNSEYIEGVIDQIVSAAEVKYPPVVLEDEIEHTIHHFEERLAQGRMDLETYLKTRDLTREQFIDQEVRDVALKSLKRNLVLEKFATVENIQISSEEARMIIDMATNQARQDPSMKSLARGGVSKKQVADNLARSTLNEVFNQRLMNRIRDIASGKADAPASEPVVEAAAEPAPETAVVEETPAAEASSEEPKAAE